MACKFLSIGVRLAKSISSVTPASWALFGGAPPCRFTREAGLTAARATRRRLPLVTIWQLWSSATVARWRRRPFGLITWQAPYKLTGLTNHREQRTRRSHGLVYNW